MGDDVGDGKGISTGSAIACKQACQENNVCKFWSFRDGWARDCYLKRGRRGDPNPTGAIPKIGFISGTKGMESAEYSSHPVFTPKTHVFSSAPVRPFAQKLQL